MSNIENMEIGERIKTIRTDMDMKQKTLAAALGIDNSRMTNIEKGAAKIYPEELSAISKILNVRVEYLLGMDSVPDYETHALNTVMSLFDEITTSKNYASGNTAIYFPEKSVFCSDGNYLVVTAKKRLFNLLEKLAERNGELKSLKNNLSKKEYKRKREEAYQWRCIYEKADARAAKRDNFRSSDDKMCSYLFVSKAQLEQYIDEKVAKEIKNREAIKLILKHTEDEEAE